MNTEVRIQLCLALSGLALAGCSVGPDYHRPAVDVTPHYGELAAGAAPSRQTEVAPPGEWWRAFNDPELDHLIAVALGENYDLRVAAERVREARYQRSIVAADLYPDIDSTAGYLRARGSKNVSLPLGTATDPPGDPPASGNGSSSSSGPVSRQAQQQIGVNPFTAPLTAFGQGGLPNVTGSLYQVGFDSNWELDVFGGTRRRLEAAAADLGAAVESLHDIMVTLLAEVARNYLELRGAQRRIDVARRNLAAEKQTLELTRSRADSGLTSQTDVVRAAAQVAITEASIPPLEASARDSIHMLSTLLAMDPDALAQELSVAKPLPIVPPEVPVGLPSDLLKRRPDIRRAERQLHAATARVGAAKADLFPVFALTGSMGLDSTSAGSLFDWQSRYFLVSPTVTWRVFDAGRILSNTARQKADREESLLRYRSIILAALREVEDALVAYATEQTRRAALADALAQDRDSLFLVQQQYDHGLANFLDVLDAERNVLATEDELAQSEQKIDTNLVALYKALGGGWQNSGRRE